MLQVQLSVVGTYDDGSSSDLSGAVEWTASDPAVAMVAPGGLLEAGWAGPVTVTAEASGVSATASLRVAGLAMLDVELLDAPTGVSAYLDGPAAVLDGRGAAIVAYGTGPSGRTLVTRTGAPSRNLGMVAGGEPERRSEPVERRGCGRWRGPRGCGLVGAGAGRRI